MSMPGQPVYLNNYTPAADIVTIAVCIVILILMAFSYIRKTSSFRIFLTIIPVLITACIADIAYNHLIMAKGISLLPVVLRCINHAALFIVFFLFTLYITVVSHMDRRKSHPILIAAFAVLIAIVCTDIVRSISGHSLVNTENGIVSHTAGVFLIGYLLFAALDCTLLVIVRNRLYKRVMMGFYGSVILSFTLLLLQRLFGQSSFTSSSFLFPVIAMFYIMHSNPYNADLGTVDSAAMQDIVRYNYEKKRTLVFVSIFFPTFNTEGKPLPASVQSVIRRFSSASFRGGVLFRVDRGHVILVFPKRHNRDYKERVNDLIRVFREQQRVYQYDYKIVIGESIDSISRKNEYISFIRNVHRAMADQAVHWISEEDLKTFDRSDYILHQLEDIHRTHDLNDKRVLVYCQPVYNLKTAQYDTAEALMRLKLDETGLVFPDQFIYLAEEHGYIHTLTGIILHKTCEELRKLGNAGFCINRISVNVSMLELKEEHFCEDISGIISRSGIPSDKVAIELTESQTESDFNVMKAKIEELKEHGIKFYLDDFGTGYSNMERIMELPFDIIKFDRSMVIASESSKRSEKIVSNLATLFTDLDYSVLYEGVETESDETLCREMSATYLQGYKYSQPIPIADLKKFVARKGKAG